MQIIDNKALHLRVRYPHLITSVIPCSQQVGEHDVVVRWGLEEAQVLKNMKIKNVPSPILRSYDWPGMHRPFTHQKTTSEFLTLHRRGFCFNSQGTGKTASVIWAADYLLKQKKINRVLVICPVSIMGSAWQGDLFRFAMHRTFEIAHSYSSERRKKIIRGGAEFVIINYDGLEIVSDAVVGSGDFDLIVVDECFVAGTQVRMGDNTNRAIEELKAGDRVLTSSGVKPIKRLIHNTTEQLVKLKLTHGPEIVCTPEHPFFTDVGWVAAKNLTGRRVVHRRELPYMRKKLSACSTPMGVAPCQGYSDWVSLLTILRSEEIPPFESGDELLQPNATRTTGEPNGHGAERCVSGKYVPFAESNEPQTKSAWGERNRDDQTREDGVSGVGATLGMEFLGSVGQEAARLSYELQARLCQPHYESRAGSRRKLPPYEIPERARRKEILEDCVIRVESVSYIKPTSPVSVYNIEVEGTPNYFVGGGVLVHNCNVYKNVHTKRWKALSKIIRPSTWVWMLTGTPASQGPSDAFGLAKIVNPSGVPKFYGAFRDQVMSNITRFKWVPKPDATAIVFKALQPAIRFTKEECLDLPDMMYVTREVPLTKQQTKYYDTMLRQQLIVAAGEEITAPTAAANLTKLLQISGGAVYTDTREVVEFDCSNRLQALKEVIDEASHKVLVFVPYTHSLVMVSEWLKKQGYTNMIINGDVSPNKRTEIFNTFQTTPEPRVLVIQPQAASHGVTLHAANVVVYWSPVMSVETYLQANARVHRAGQVNKVTVVHLQGSRVESKMYRMLQSKVDTHQRLVDLYKEELGELGGNE